MLQIQQLGQCLLPSTWAVLHGSNLWKYWKRGVQMTIGDLPFEGCDLFNGFTDESLHALKDSRATHWAFAHQLLGGSSDLLLIATSHKGHRSHWGTNRFQHRRPCASFSPTAHPVSTSQQVGHHRWEPIGTIPRFMPHFFSPFGNHLFYFWETWTRINGS